MVGEVLRQDLDHRLEEEAVNLLLLLQVLPLLLLLLLLLFLLLPVLPDLGGEFVHRVVLVVAARQVAEHVPGQLVDPLDHLHRTGQLASPSSSADDQQEPNHHQHNQQWQQTNHYHDSHTYLGHVGLELRARQHVLEGEGG